MAKKVVGVVKLQIKAGKATPAPPVGPALSQYGINIMEFVKGYNERTAQLVGTVAPVEITVYEDRSFTFVIKQPPASQLICKAAGIEKGSGAPPKTTVGKLTWDQVLEIARTKMPELNANDEHAAARVIAGTARSMGVVVEEPTA